VDKAVSDASHVWNDTRRDLGIDGHIEFVDIDTQVSGFTVAAQVKGTAVGFEGDSPSGSGFAARQTTSLTGCGAVGRWCSSALISGRSGPGGNGLTRGLLTRSAEPAAWSTSTRTPTRSRCRRSVRCPRSRCRRGSIAEAGGQRAAGVEPAGGHGIRRAEATESCRVCQAPRQPGEPEHQSCALGFNTATHGA
jgi:hypothetical protein